MACRVRPSFVGYNDQSITIKLPLIRANRNHLNSMYFGALATGADLTGGFLAIEAIRQSGVRINMVFKSVNAVFQKRAEGDVFFTCDQVAEVRALVDHAIKTGERAEMPLKVVATVPSKLDEPVAIFDLMLSIKKKEARPS